VVGFGDAPEAEAAGLTVVAADVIEQGRRTARQLISQIEGQRISGVTVLQVRLIVRDTSRSAL
jgi:DNA-binding LacI/PurR family transcriptional regulator